MSRPEPLTVAMIEPWWLRSGVRPVPPNPIEIPEVVPTSPVGAVEAATAVATPTVIAFDKTGFASAMLAAGHDRKYAVGTAQRADRLFALVPAAMKDGSASANDEALSAIPPKSLKKALQAARMAAAWMRGEGVPAPKPAMGGRRKAA